MTSIERTAYPRFGRPPSVKELRTIYTPTALPNLIASGKKMKYLWKE